MTDEPPELEHSPLSCEVTRDGITVRVQIYRLAGSDNEWSLEVIDAMNTSTVWLETFKTDQAAYDEFQRTLTAEGMASLLEERSAKLH
jgi:hypothetical protein